MARKRHIPEKIQNLVYKKYGHRKTCPYCKRRYNELRIFRNVWREIDHIIPESRGGLTVIENLILVCSNCNRSKKDNILKEWKNAKR